MQKVILSFLILFVHIYAKDSLFFYNNYQKQYNNTDNSQIKPIVEYRMDECYWITGDNSVKDSSISKLDAEAMNGAKIDKTNKIIYHSVYLDGDDDYLVTNSSDILDFNTTMTITMWINPQNNNDQVLLVRYEESGPFWMPLRKGWVLGFSRLYNQLSFMLQTDSQVQSVAIKPKNWNDEKWHFISIRYDGDKLTLTYDEQTSTQNISGSIINADIDMLIGANQDGNSVSHNFQGYIDEIKIFNITLTDDEIKKIQDNDLHQNNYDGSYRQISTCNASIKANSWELVGIPADFRKNSNPKSTVADIFSDDMHGEYGSDWILYKRDYSDINNSSWYTVLNEDEELAFGKGYWLGSKFDNNWSENGASIVDFNSSYNTTNDCISHKCVEIDLTSTSKDFEEDGDDGTGAYRYNMVGFIGKTPINWADCRFIVMDLDGNNKEILTPTDMEDRDYAKKQIWIYNPSTNDANNNGYITCNDTTPGGCMLEPYKGFWIELHGKTKNKIVKLLLPQGE